MSPDAPTIVIVDDADEVRFLVRTRLRLSGRVNVIAEGADGTDAVVMAAEHSPDLMLLDVSMPGMDGLTALPLVLEASPRTRVVVFSGFKEQGLVEKAEALGAAAFIEKSTPIDTLVERLVSIHHAAAGTAAPFARAADTVTGVRSADQRVLDEHLERFREVFEAAAIGMATMTLAGTLVRVNTALANLMARRRDDLVGTFYGDLTDGRGAEVVDALDEIRKHPVDIIHLEHGVSDATDGVQLRSTLAPVRDSGGRPLYVFLQVQDVTAERQALARLRRSEQRFRLLVEAVEDYAIFMLSPEGVVASWNAGAERSKGYTADQIIGQHFRVFYPPEMQERRHPEHELQAALREGRYEEEGWRVRKDGTRFWANVVITALFDEQGEHVGFAKVTRDTTERRRLEQRLQQAAADQAEFLAVTAHELRTPIGVLGGAAQTLADFWTEMTDDERGELFESMATSTNRLRRLLADLLTASRLQTRALEVESTTVPVDGFLSDAISAVRQTSPGVAIHLEAPPDLFVIGDRDRLAQVMDNLIANALRHGAPPVHVVVTCEEDRVLVRVSDDGSGVPEGMQGRLFDRFATGRSKGGTGLGLFIVRELVRAQGGEAYYEPATAENPAGVFVVSLRRAGSP